jgi:hypothetical protein
MDHVTSSSSDGQFVTADKQVMTDQRSRWVDGVLASLAFLGLVVVLIVATILAKRAGPMVLLVETAVMLTLSLFCLLRALDGERTAVHQAWYGILSGFFAWTALEAGALLGQLAIETERGVILFLVLGGFVLVVAQRGGLPLIGAQFWLGAFFANWVGHLVLFTQRYLAQDYPVFTITYRVSGGLAALGIVGVYGWIFKRSRTRLQRLWAALSVFVLIIIVVYAVRGFW